MTAGEIAQACRTQQAAAVRFNQSPCNNQEERRPIIQGVDSSNNGVSLNSGGYLDDADCNAISGWAWDGNQPNTAINVDIYDGNTLIETVAANQFRQDLLNAGIGNGVHGFSIATPASLKNGAAHTIHMKFAGTTAELSGSPKSIAGSTAIREG